MNKAIRKLVKAALEEDIGQEDITTNCTVPADSTCHVRLVAKQDGVVSGIEIFRLVFEDMNSDVENWRSMNNGDHFTKGDEIANFTGHTRGVLTGERVAMNFITHLSGVATLTWQYMEAVKGLNVRICDTRKTTPLMRQLEKEAVLHGGGSNHRHTLFHGVVIKENHVTAAGGVTQAVHSAVEGVHHLMKIEVEVSNLDEFDEALAAGADVIMLDNMSLEDMTEAVRRSKGHKIVLEASGNATLARVRAMAETGVDVISVGAITHSAPVADLSLLIEKA